MMEFVITISMNNAAFEEQPNLELARILRKLADRLETEWPLPDGTCVLRDINGNSVGTAQVKANR